MLSSSSTDAFKTRPPVSYDQHPEEAIKWVIDFVEYNYFTDQEEQLITHPKPRELFYAFAELYTEKLLVGLETKTLHLLFDALLLHPEPDDLFCSCHLLEEVGALNHKNLVFLTSAPPAETSYLSAIIASDAYHDRDTRHSIERFKQLGTSGAFKVLRRLREELDDAKRELNPHRLWHQNNGTVTAVAAAAAASASASASASATSEPARINLTK